MGEILGIFIIIFYALAVMKYLLRITNKFFQNMFVNSDKALIFYNKIRTFIVKRHNIFGFMTILLIIAHFTVQYLTIKLSITGLVASSLMIMQFLLGIYGSKAKNKWKYWIYIHRIIAILLLVAIIIHVA